MSLWRFDLLTLSSSQLLSNSQLLPQVPLSLQAPLSHLRRYSPLRRKPQEGSVVVVREQAINAKPSLHLEKKTRGAPLTSTTLRKTRRAPLTTPTLKKKRTSGQMRSISSGARLTLRKRLHSQILQKAERSSLTGAMVVQDIVAKPAALAPRACEGAGCFYSLYCREEKFSETELPV